MNIVKSIFGRRFVLLSLAVLGPTSTRANLIGTSASKDLPSCLDILLSADSFIGSCTNTWKELKPVIRPTQTDVGIAWVARKVCSFAIGHADSKPLLCEQKKLFELPAMHAGQ
jgi:hypothetical protein